MSKHENQPASHEQSHTNEALEKVGIEQREHLREELEKASSKESERDTDITSVQREALVNAASSEKVNHEQTHRESSPAERRGPITKKQLDARFNDTMQAVREELSPQARTFSKLIHNKAVEKTSDVIGNTIARPNALLAGAIGAFVLTLAIYLFAKNMGYRLSGFEPIAAFLIGWVIGLLYDYFKVMITGKKQS